MYKQEEVNAHAREVGDKDRLIAELKEKHGDDNVWTTQELSQQFTVLQFAAPYVVVERQSDGARGTVEFTHDPRVYYAFRKAD
jgi:hypothetical protein